MAYGTWTGIPEALAAFTDMSKRVKQATRLTTAMVAADLEKTAKSNFVGSHARGRPHIPNGPPDRPNVVTGTLRRSIRASPIISAAGGYSTAVGPTAIYGRRVELGFVGTDSLGRRYNQRPFFYFLPAAQAVRARALGIAAANWAAATR